ncbi:velvet factor-domain-containing protein [Fusarium tricinctum]|uniref:Velvet factor-domain-containing protein n=1 Tax=Fusarium tricinctum TaxID=61284 RepID=A0A8K0S226_9HYPO|nr:velvet factor-domain-containing protein [Fusarium tricinctum]
MTQPRRSTASMSFTFTETAAESSEQLTTMPQIMSENMPRSYVTTAPSWTPDNYHSFRGPTPVHHQHQMSSPANFAPVNPEHRRSSQPYHPQRQPSGNFYQHTDMSSSVPQNLHHPPPQGLHSHYSVGNMVGHGDMVGQQGYSPRAQSFSSQAGERLDNIQGRQMEYPTRPYSVPNDQPPSFSHDQRRPSIDVSAVPRFTEHPFNPTATANGGLLDPNSPMVSPTELRPDPMRISDILSTGEGNNTPTSSENRAGDIHHILKIRQQPTAARSCGFGERDRRVIDPPPIVQLSIESPRLSREEISKELRYPHYVMSCSILDETGSHDASFMPEEYRHQRRLMGLLVSSPFVGKDEHGEEGCFFCFPDLSCRTPGSFRLKFSLVRIDPLRAREIKNFPALVAARSDIFTVYTAKDFPGMQASTQLTKRLKEQGCIISIKKGNDRSKNARGHDDSSDGDQEDGEAATQGKRRRRSTRQ